MVTIKKNTPERFRTIPDQQIYSPFDIDLDLYEIASYSCGGLKCMTKGLTLAHFDSFQVIKLTENIKNRIKFVEVLAHRIREKQFTHLTLKLK